MKGVVESPPRGAERRGRAAAVKGGLGEAPRRIDQGVTRNGRSMRKPWRARKPRTCSSGIAHPITGREARTHERSVRATATRPPVHRPSKNEHRNPSPSLSYREPQVGIEPTTARLRIECSTTELLWRPAHGDSREQSAICHLPSAFCHLSFHALARIRTETRFRTTPSRWRVYQFHHQGKPYHTLPSAFCHLPSVSTGATGLEPAAS